MSETNNVVKFERSAAPPKPALAKIRLFDAFSEATDRPMGLTGLIRGYDPDNREFAIVDIGEKEPVKVHNTFYELIA